jgi:hypothetical protein
MGLAVVEGLSLYSRPRVLAHVHSNVVFKWGVTTHRRKLFLTAAGLDPENRPSESLSQPHDLDGAANAFARGTLVYD